jgi:hypothetical protein
MPKRLQKLLAAVATASAVTSVSAQTPSRVTSGATTQTRAQTGVRRGRPRKFNRPSSSVTLTLPDDIVAILQRVDLDLSRAVVRAVRPLAAHSQSAPAELATYGDRMAVILVPPSHSLQERIGVELVPLWDGRALIAFGDHLSIADVELRLGDAIADSALPATDKVMFQELMSILQSARRAGTVAVSRRSIIVLHRTTPQREDGRATNA